MGLYREILGERFAQLPPSVQQLHDPKTCLLASGRCSVQRTGGIAGAAVGALMGFPPAGEDLPLQFLITVRDGAEHWRRQFGASVLESVFVRHGSQLRERMGPLNLEQGLEWRDGLLHLLPLRGWFLGIPLPAFLLPRVRAVAGEEQGPEGPRYCFDVAAGLPLLGEIVRYRGWLKIDEAS